MRSWRSPLSVRHRVQHAERDRRQSTGPVQPYEESAGQAIRSRTTGSGAKDVPAGAMSYASGRALSA
ncbi:hypothetical protein F5983_28945 [Streptomyces arboris]|uniref:Uncharacterized protein n=1 Tax=Streptomyces arboris TaxID=2600619 RepID=A0A5N5EFY2_9ACTN|nr:hypothetical protein F5983_28945 [Streptomyces arboris]